MSPYKEKFPIGREVQIVDIELRKDFQQKWKHHHKLDSAQIPYANQNAKVEKVSFYHGGDVLYELRGIFGIWHEQCLRPYRWQRGHQ